MRKKIDRKKQILEEATKLFSAHGYDKVTVKDLSMAVGISEPALYRHYQSKAAIYDTVLLSIESRLDCTDLFIELEKIDDLDKILKTLASHILVFFTANEDLYRLLLYSALKGHEKANQIYQIIRGSYIKFLIKKFDELYQKGTIIEKKNDITARCFVGMVFDCSLGTTLWKNFQGKVYKPHEVIANNIPIYVKGLSTKAE